MTEISRCILEGNNSTLSQGHCAAKSVLLVIIIFLCLLLFMMIMSLITPMSVRVTLSWLICHSRDRLNGLEAGLLKKRKGSSHRRQNIFHSDILNSDIANINVGNHSSRGCRHKCENSSGSESYSPPLLSPLIRMGSETQNPHYLRQQKERKKEVEKSVFLFDQVNDPALTETDRLTCKFVEHVVCESEIATQICSNLPPDDANPVVFTAQDHHTWFNDDLSCIASYKSDSAIFSSGFRRLFEASETRCVCPLPTEISSNSNQPQLTSTVDELINFGAHKQKIENTGIKQKVTPLVKIFPPSPSPYMPSALNTDLVDQVKKY